MSRQANHVDSLIWVKAEILWRLADRPRVLPDAETTKSLRLDGWLQKHPATMLVSTNSVPHIHGHHRLALLAADGQLNNRVPCVLRMCHYDRPLSDFLKTL
mgnify:FL=1|tara:strand:- start:1194 stop:1496 length:303 start_codon:yes stop_codon:yes gene_type:complete